MQRFFSPDENDRLVFMEEFMLYFENQTGLTVFPFSAVGTSGSLWVIKVPHQGH